MADMNTTYQNGGVQTTTRVDPLPGMTGGPDYSSFFRMMAERAMKRDQERRDAEKLARKEAQRARFDAEARQNNGASYVKNVGGFGNVPGAIQVHAGDPGAVFGGNWGNAPQGAGGDYAGRERQVPENDFLRYQAEQRARGMRTDGRAFDPKPGSY